MERPDLSPEILEYYTSQWDENARLRRGMGELEFLRTQEIVRRHLTGSLRILDVGGASGVHAEWLLEDGHIVHLIDPVPRHIEEARRSLGDHQRFSAAVGDGRSLDVPDRSFDVVLLFGPLYHLTEREDRLAAWREAARAVVPGGLVIGAVISRFSSLFSGLSGGDLFDPEFREVVRQDLLDGQHRNPTGGSDAKEWFTTAYFHHPDDVTIEAAEAGLVVDSILGVEGISAWIPRLERSWENPGQREAIVEAARSIESEPTLSGLGPHLLAIAHTPLSVRR